MLGPSPVAARRGEEVPVLRKELGDASTFHGTGQMEAAVAARLAAGDGGPALATDKAVLEGAEQPPSAAASGPPQAAPHLRAGRRTWPLLGHSPQIRLADEAPALEPLQSCWEQDFCPRAGWKGWEFFLGVWAKLPQTSPGTNLPVLVRSSPSVLPGRSCV